MNNRRNILYILLAVFGLILLFNYIVIPLLSSNYLIRGNRMGMGMGMHGYLNYSNYYALFQFILLVGGIAIAVLLLVSMMNSDQKCGKCGYQVRSEKWRICPRCGTPIQKRKG